MQPKLMRYAAAAVAFAGITGGAIVSSQAAVDTANATATVIPAIAISKTIDLAFASVVPAGGADTVIVSAAGSRTCGGTLTCTGTVAAASFDVTGGASLTYAVTLPASTVINDGGPNNMTVNTFTDSISSSGTLSGGGTQTFTVGATLQVGASQVAGSYTGTFNVTVLYN